MWKEEKVKHSFENSTSDIFYFSVLNLVFATSTVINLTGLPLITENDVLLRHLFSKIIHTIQDTQ